MTDSEQRVEEFQLDKESELRFEVESGSTVQLELINGKAEIFGSELTSGRKYSFNAGSKVAVFSWHSCQIKLTGRTEVAYISKETPMVVYLNAHVALEQMREKSEKDETRGPRLLVVGPSDVGKTTLCNMLLNYGVRMGRAPVFVDLDVGQGQVSIPGTMGAYVVERPADIEEGFTQSAPLVFHFGHTTPSKNLTLYNLLVSRIADVIEYEINRNKKVNHSGVIVNTGGWVRGSGYDSLKHAAGSFEVDVIAVMDQERLYSELKRDMPDFVKIILLPKSGGVVERNQTSRSESRDAKVREYFYGLKNSLFPHTFEVNCVDIKIYKIGAPALPDSCLPLGMKSQDNKTKLVPLTPGTSLLHHVYSISCADSTEDNILETNIIGFVVFTEFHPEKLSFTVLSPAPHPLPKHILLQTDIQFMDIQ
ncbi:polyribonucleotide 5'-hydroxyl-kinase Clp1-like [Ruditapes philippinarum]|uniref:polyribonucleotide 5'-hydroxyl-kinase Clp1-like n=1 Tax=Ruditapes philippinarum TaxID=129788 RepID=UPI00295B21C6|nr:polyribonucleotide 5'-hydroxyl-kinase Clp1-like [Ruditapes philippinarum]